MNHVAVGLAAVIGTSVNDGLYGLCSCGFVGYAIRNPNPPETIENEIAVHIEKANRS
jgi:hypothetical protein